MLARFVLLMAGIVLLPSHAPLIGVILIVCAVV